MSAQPEWPLAYLPKTPDPWESRDMQVVVEGRVMLGLREDAEQLGGFAIIRANPHRMPDGAVKLPPPLELADGIAVELGSELVYPLGDGKNARGELRGSPRTRETMARRVSGVLRWWVESRKGVA